MAKQGGNTKTIGGKTYRLALNGNVSGKKANATKSAERFRKDGYSVRVIKAKRVVGRAKDSKGKTTKVMKNTRYDVWIRKK